MKILNKSKKFEGKEVIENRSKMEEDLKILNKIENNFEVKKINLNNPNNDKHKTDIKNTRKESEQNKIESKFQKGEIKKNNEIMNNYIQEKSKIEIKNDSNFKKNKGSNIDSRQQIIINPFKKENENKDNKYRNYNKIQNINEDKLIQKDININNQKNYEILEDEKIPNYKIHKYEESEDKKFNELKHLKSESEIEFNIDNKFQQKKANIKNSVLSNIKGSTNLYMDNPLVIQLIELGTEPAYAQRIYQFLHPRDFDEALDYLLKINGIIQHNFVIDRNFNNKNCYLCGEEPEIHLNWKKNSILKRSIYNFDGEQLKTSEKKIMCDICGEDFIPDKNNTVDKCKHSYCNSCWYDFISINIKENKLKALKCQNHECNEKISNKFILNIIKNDEILIRKYKRYKLELKIINDPNKKLCPYPNCDSYLELIGNKIQEAKCKNDHKFCFLCLKEPHGKLACNNNLDGSIVEFAKKNFIKKCPKCQMVTEKNGGCNHITCKICQYQWCWLCNKKYKIGHFDSGKCRGLQFFKPENEYEIELAQKGKIQLKESQIQHDLNIDNFNLDINEINDINNNINDRSIRRNIRGFDDRNRSINILNRQNNNHKKFKMIVIYIFFGFLILALILGINKARSIKEKSLILFYLYFLLFGFIYYVLMVEINILMLIPFIIYNGFSGFIDKCSEAWENAFEYS